MKELKLIDKKLGSGVLPTVNARELHFELDSKKDFSSWIKARIDKYGFIDGEDYIVLLTQLGEQTGRGGSNKTEYFISLDMAKELAMVEATQKGREARQYFIGCEKKLRALEKMRLTVNWQEARANGKCIRNVLTDSVKALERIADKQGGEKGKPESRHYYESTTKMIYKQLFGDSTLKDVRNKMDVLQLQFLSICEHACADEIGKLVELELDYHDIYSESKKRVIATVKGLSASKLTSSGEVVKLAWDKAKD